MNDKRAIVNQIEDALGTGGDYSLAEGVYDLLRARGKILWDDRRGLLLNPAEDLIQVATEILGKK